MPTNPITVNSETYTKVADAADSDFLISNEGTSSVSVVFITGGGGVPVPGTLGHRLTFEDRGIDRVAGTPSGDVYAKVKDDGRADQEMAVTIG